MISYCVLKDFKFKTLKVRKKLSTRNKKKIYFLQTMIIILYIKNTGDIFTKYFKKSFSTTGNDFLFFFHFGVTLRRKYDIRI